jgi:hypothetical protein
MQREHLVMFCYCDNRGTGARQGFSDLAAGEAPANRHRLDSDGHHADRIPSLPKAAPFGQLAGNPIQVLQQFLPRLAV